MAKKICMFLIILFMSQIIVGCAREDKLLVRVGTMKITIKDFKRKIERVPSYYQGFLTTEGGSKQFLDGLAKEKVLIYQSQREKIHQREDIKQQIEDAREQILLEAMVEELKKDRIYVPDGEIKEYYEKNKDEYLHPEKVRASHILVKTRGEAEDILKKLNEGSNFASLAKQYSMDVVTAPNGGDIDYFERGEMVPEFEKAVFNLKNTGDITGVIRTQFGYHIAKLTGRKRMEAKTLEEASDEIRKMLQKDKFDKVVDDYMKEYNTKVYYDRLKEVFRDTGDIETEVVESEEEEGKVDKK